MDPPEDQGDQQGDGSSGVPPFNAATSQARPQTRIGNPPTFTPLMGTVGGAIPRRPQAATMQPAIQQPQQIQIVMGHMADAPNHIVTAAGPGGIPPFGALGQNFPMRSSAAEVPFDPNTRPPFIDLCILYIPRDNGVYKVGNIPFTLSGSELLQFIGKYVPATHIIEAHVEGFPIHIIMERSTGKTMDAYIEFKSAEQAAESFEANFGPNNMRVPKIGQRNVDMTLSNQGELMRDMFPRGKSLHFDEENGTPVLLHNRDVYSGGFNGFMTNEEITCMARHAEYPQRSQFASRSMNRTFESMVSTLYKFPWQAVKLYTMRDCLNMFINYKKQLDVLMFKVLDTNIPREVGLDNKLLMDHIFAGLNAPGFSERQKAQIVEGAAAWGNGFPLRSNASIWPFQTLAPYPSDLSDQDVSMWLSVMDIGMTVLEGEGRDFIGVSPYLEVTRDFNGQVLFNATEEYGLKLKRAQFSLLEVRVANDMVNLGWSAYQYNLGLPQPYVDTDNLYVNQEFIVNIVNDVPQVPDPFGNVPTPEHVATGSYVINDRNIPAEGDDQLDSIVRVDEEFIEAGNTGVAGDFNDPQRALENFREVIRDVNAAPPSDTLPSSSGNDDDGGLGCGLANLRFNSIADTPQAHARGNRARTFGASLNAESPAFEPAGPRFYAQGQGFLPRGPTATVDADTATAFASGGLGNGDFITSPPRPGRRSTAAGAVGDVKGKGKEKESALTAPAGNVRLGSRTPFMQPNVFGGPIFARQAQVGQSSNNPFGGPLAMAQVPNRARRGVAIQSPTDGSITNLRPAPALPTNTDGPGPAVPTNNTNASGHATYRPPHARNGTIVNETGTVLRRHAAVNRTDGVHDFLDNIFHERTTSNDRNLLDAATGVVDRPPSPAEVFNAPPNSPVLHRSPARENLTMPTTPRREPTSYDSDDSDSSVDGPPPGSPVLRRSPRKENLRAAYHQTGGMNLPKDDEDDDLYY